MGGCLGPLPSGPSFGQESDCCGKQMEPGFVFQFDVRHLWSSTEFHEFEECLARLALKHCRLLRLSHAAGFAVHAELERTELEQSHSFCKWLSGGCVVAGFLCLAGSGEESESQCGPFGGRVRSTTWLNSSVRKEKELESGPTRTSSRFPLRSQEEGFWRK